MKTLEFSIRDWRKGQEVICKMGFTDDLVMSTQVELNLEEWQVEDIEDELNGLDIEFEWL
jgi:hypothetical protein